MRRRFLLSDLRPARCQIPAAAPRRTGYITHDAVRSSRARSSRSGARVRGSFARVLAELQLTGVVQLGLDLLQDSAPSPHIQDCSTCWLLQSVCTASKLPPPTLPHSLCPNPSLPLSLTSFLSLPPHEILQYASKFPDPDSLLSRFSFKASDSPHPPVLPQRKTQRAASVCGCCCSARSSPPDWGQLFGAPE